MNRETLICTKAIFTSRVDDHIGGNMFILPKRIFVALLLCSWSMGSIGQSSSSHLEIVCRSAIKNAEFICGPNGPGTASCGQALSRAGDACSAEKIGDSRDPEMKAIACLNTTENARLQCGPFGPGPGSCGFAISKSREACRN